MDRSATESQLRMIGFAVVNASGPESFTAMLEAVEQIVTKRQVVKMYLKLDLPVGDNGHRMSEVLEALKEQGLEIGHMSPLMDLLDVVNSMTAVRVVRAFDYRVRITAKLRDYRPDNLLHVLVGVGDVLTEAQLKELRKMRPPLRSAEDAMKLREMRPSPAAPDEDKREGGAYAMSMLSRGFVTAKNVQAFIEDLEQVEAVGPALLLTDYSRVIDQKKFVADLTRYPHMEESPKTDYVFSTTKKIIVDVMKRVDSDATYLYPLHAHMRAPKSIFTDASTVIAWGLRDQRITPRFLYQLRCTVQRIELSKHVSAIDNMLQELAKM